MRLTVLRLAKTFSSIALVLCVSCGEKADREKKEDAGKTENDTVLTAANTNTIVFFGNSLTAGHGLSQDQAYPALIQERLDALQWPYQVVNAGLSGDTSRGGLNRIDWVLQQPVDLFVLELGANDGLRGLPVAETRKNLEAIIAKVHEKDSTIPVVLAGMKLPPNLGNAYKEDFEGIFPDLARDPRVFLVPFLLEGVAGKPKLNLADGIHPNASGHVILAENVWNVLAPLLEEVPTTVP